jgi:hypothetical protein
MLHVFRAHAKNDKLRATAVALRLKENTAVSCRYSACTHAGNMTLKEVC